MLPHHRSASTEHSNLPPNTATSLQYHNFALHLSPHLPSPWRYHSAFGSHVAEALLERLGGAYDAGLSDEDASALTTLLDSLAGAVGDQLYDYLMDRHATHVARALLRVAAGRDVVPASKQGKVKQQEKAAQRGDGAAGGGGRQQHGGGAKVRRRSGSVADALDETYGKGLWCCCCGW